MPCLAGLVSCACSRPCIGTTTSTNRNCKLQTLTHIYVHTAPGYTADPCTQTHRHISHKHNKTQQTQQTQQAALRVSYIKAPASAAPSGPRHCAPPHARAAGTAPCIWGVSVSPGRTRPRHAAATCAVEHGNGSARVARRPAPPGVGLGRIRTAQSTHHTPHTPSALPGAAHAAGLAETEGLLPLDYR